MVCILCGRSVKCKGTLIAIYLVMQCRFPLEIWMFLQTWLDLTSLRIWSESYGRRKNSTVEKEDSNYKCLDILLAKKWLMTFKRREKENPNKVTVHKINNEIKTEQNHFSLALYNHSVKSHMSRIDWLCQKNTKSDNMCSKHEMRCIFERIWSQTKANEANYRRENTNNK